MSRPGFSTLTCRYGSRIFTNLSRTPNTFKRLSALFSPLGETKHMYRTQIAVLMLTAAAAQAAEPPVIRAMIPENGAASFGQMITIQGFGLAPSNRPTVIFTPALEGDDITCNFI